MPYELGYSLGAIIRYRRSCRFAGDAQLICGARAEADGQGDSDGCRRAPQHCVRRRGQRGAWGPGCCGRHVIGVVFVRPSSHIRVRRLRCVFGSTECWGHVQWCVRPQPLYRISCCLPPFSPLFSPMRAYVCVFRDPVGTSSISAYPHVDRKCQSCNVHSWVPIAVRHTHVQTQQVNCET